ncbi:MAG: hypothetical protein ACUVWX_07435 [Kiritimatiellia bacterium]
MAAIEGAVLYAHVRRGTVTLWIRHAATGRAGLFGLPRTRTSPGQALIESCIAVALICIVFFGLFQLSQLAVGREVLHHAAARAARARTVGFNRWMVTKCARVALIPNAGKMLEPQTDFAPSPLLDMVLNLKPGELWDEALRSYPTSPQYEIERVRIPEYLASRNPGRAAATLDYEDWDHIAVQDITDATKIHSRARQEYPLRIPLHRAFYATDDVTLEGESHIENHYSLYIDDRGW